MSQAVKRACDACHRRKVKCDGINPCRNCSSAQLACTYNAIPQKKGPKGSRAKVISELRETQRQTSLSAKVQNRINGIACHSTGASLTPTPGLLTSELVKDCAQFFFDNMYTQTPILDSRQVEQQVLYMEQNRDAYCLMTSLCAFVMLQPGMSMPPGDPYNLDMVPGANIVSSQLLLEECLRVRKGYEYLDSITTNALATNFFLFGCYYGQEMHDKAWYYIREATTMIIMAGMNKEEHYMQLDPTEASRRRRLFWLFFVLERAYGIQRQRPLSIQATINMPAAGDDPSDPLSHQLNSFILLVNLFRPFDDAFTALWNKTRGDLSSQHISSLQKQLHEVTQQCLCQDSNLHDLHTNQQYLKSSVWQLSNGVVGGHGEDSLSFQYPMNMSRELLMNIVSSFPSQGMGLVNTGLVEKMLETAYSMTEYLAMQPASRDPFTVGPREHLNHIIAAVAMARNGDYRFMPLVMHKLSEVLPRSVNPMLQNAPENTTLANIDIFDGFGNAGMAQPPAPMHMPIESDYEKKYAVEVNGTTPESSHHSHGTPPMAGQSSSDMGNSFVSSPTILSPAMEYPSMNGFMSEMVMGSMGNHGQTQHLSSQHMSHEGMGQYMNGMNQQSIKYEGMVGMRPPLHRQDSYHMHSQQQMRAMGDFHGLQ